MKIDEILVQMGSRRFDQNQVNLTQKNIIQNLELEKVLNINTDLEQNFENFRIICDPASHEKLASDVQFSVSLQKYWKSVSFTKRIRLAYNKDFSKFGYISAQACENPQNEKNAFYYFFYIFNLQYNS